MNSDAEQTQSFIAEFKMEHLNCNFATRCCFDLSNGNSDVLIQIETCDIWSVSFILFEWS